MRQAPSRTRGGTSQRNVPGPPGVAASTLMGHTAPFLNSTLPRAPISPRPSSPRSRLVADEGEPAMPLRAWVLDRLDDRRGRPPGASASTPAIDGLGFIPAASICAVSRARASGLRQHEVDRDVHDRRPGHRFGKLLLYPRRQRPEAIVGILRSAFGGDGVTNEVELMVAAMGAMTAGRVTRRWVDSPAAAITASHSLHHDGRARM